LASCLILNNLVSMFIFPACAAYTRTKNPFWMDPA
jgi:hypothetical protein